MTKNEFLAVLKSELQKNNVQNISEILSDYEEHFVHGLQSGKSEQAITEKLGNPATIAKAYETEKLISQVKDPKNQFQVGTALKVLGRLIVIAPFNFIILFIPGIFIFSMVVVGWSMVVASGGLAIGILGTIFKLSLSTLSSWALIALGSSFFASVGWSLLAALIMFAISKYILLALINYLQWNLKFVLDQSDERK